MVVYLEKICRKCWKKKRSTEFSRRGNARRNVCRACQKKVFDRWYAPRRKNRPGVRRAAPRPGDERQARHTINYLVRSGKIPHANALPCVRCQHKNKGDRDTDSNFRIHEYHHHKGYDAQHHRTVEVVCKPCHVAETFKRNEPTPTPW